MMPERRQVKPHHHKVSSSESVQGKS